MSEQAVYSLSINRKTGELQVQPQERTDDVVNQEFKRIIDQQSQSKYLTLGLIISFLLAFVVIALFKDDIKFGIALIVLTVAAILGYIAVNYIDHLNIKYIVNTFANIIQKPVPSDQNNDITDQKIDPNIVNNLMDEKKKKKNVYF